MEIATVGALRKYLSQFPDETMIVGTWEGILKRIYAYCSKDGVVIIDADGSEYQDTFDKLEIKPESDTW